MADPLVLGWASGGSTTLSLRDQPTCLDALAHDGPCVDGLRNWLRASISDLATAPLRWASDTRWDVLAFDELIIGRSGHDASEWSWRGTYYRDQCAASSGRRPITCLAWNCEWGEANLALVEPTLRTLAPVFDYFAFEAYLDATVLTRAPERLRQLMAASAQAGVWSRTVVLWNWSDRPELWPLGRHYAVFRGGVDDERGDRGLYAVEHAYADLRAYGAGLGTYVAEGYWSADYIARSAPRLDTFLRARSG